MHISSAAPRSIGRGCPTPAIRQCCHHPSNTASRGRLSAKVAFRERSGRNMISQASSTDSGVKTDQPSVGGLVEEGPTKKREPGKQIEIDLDPDSETAKKQEEQDRLRSAEKFMVKGSGKALCISCGYEYEKQKGDPEYPITPGTEFEELPRDWQCPVCGAAKNTFQSQSVKVAGFAENQQYGFGGNSLTSGQKSLLIYGSLLLFFGLFLAGYLLQ